MSEHHSIDLNIIDRGLDGQEWTSERGKITKDDLYKIHEQKTSNGGALNALPTPFARFFVFREAFRRVYDEKVNPQNEAGKAYRRLVSDCLDVYELLFNLKYHRNHWAAQRDIVIREWDYETHVKSLEKSMPILAHAVRSYYDTDIQLDKLFFILLRENGKEKLLATSSPITGFVTPPDLDRKDWAGEGNILESKPLGERYAGLKIAKRPKDGQRARGSYFSGAEELFEDRPADFKNYMYSMFCGPVGERMAEIKRYVTSFGDTDPDIRTDIAKDWAPLKSEDNAPLQIEGLTVCCSNAIDVNKFFTDTIIKLPYRISSDNFYTPAFDGSDERDYDYLLPLTEEAVGILDINAMDCRLREKVRGVTVELTFQGKVYTKTYGHIPSPVEGMGKIVDLAKALKTNLEVGLFPNIKSPVKEENNYYKLMLVVSDENAQRTLDIHQTSCTFFVQKDTGDGNVAIEETDGKYYQNGMRHAVVRSEQDADTPCSTKYYEVFNTEVSAIALHLSVEGSLHSGVLIPKFHQSSNPNKDYTYAIDFGTSSTYISKRLKGSNLEPEQLSMSDTMMSYLHAVRKSRQQAPIDLWEDIPFKQSADFFHTEFIPPFIDGRRYKFPLRSAMVRTRREHQEANLFDNRNIAFSYEKRKIVGDHEVTTDLKWNEHDVVETRLFIRELLLIIKCDALLSDARLAQTEIVWFFPLSLTSGLKDKYRQIWEEETRSILGIPSSQVRSYTESEAPYYYYAEKDAFQSIDSVVVMDIGGGSTDMVYFNEGKPQMANSVHFGCDVLWGNGYNKMSNARDNGIYNRYKGLISFGSDEELNELNEEMLRPGSTVSTCDIIDFWLSNNAKTRMGHGEHLDAYLCQECKPLFLYHYASLIFYLAHLLHAQGLPCPNAITFSGNGSRYIDGFISSDIDTLTDLTMIVLRAVFGEDTRRVQLILREKRKESTCYGGLYRDKNKPSPETVVFHGVVNKQYETVADITRDYAEGTLRADIIRKIGELNVIYMKMLRMLIGREALDSVSTSAIEAEIQSGIAEALDKNFKEEVRDALDPNRPYRDSLFFIPVIDKVTGLTLIDKYTK